MKILVTGAAGFIASNLIPELNKIADVTGIDVAPPRVRPAGVRYEQVDINDGVRVRSLLRSVRPDWIFHLGARTDLNGRTIGDYDTNVGGTLKLMRAAAEYAPTAHIVYASSRLVFAITHKPSHEFDYLPSTPYGYSKVAMERLIRESALPNSWTIVRPTSIWGPWFGTPYRDFFNTIANSTYVHPRGVNVRKSFGYVGNAAHQLKSLISSDRNIIQGQVYWLSDYEPINVIDWSRLIADELGVRRPREVPMRLLRAAARGGDAFKALGWKSPPLTSFRLNNLITDMVYDTTSSRAVFGELPYSLEEGVARTVDWVRHQG